MNGHGPLFIVCLCIPLIARLHAKVPGTGRSANPNGLPYLYRKALASNEGIVRHHGAGRILILPAGCYASFDFDSFWFGKGLLCEW
jgi:hypothetical protein